MVSIAGALGAKHGLLFWINGEGTVSGIEAGTAQRSWTVTEPAGYAAARAALQKQQIVTAGARFAQVLQTVWP